MNDFNHTQSVIFPMGVKILNNTFFFYEFNTDINF